MVLSFLNLPQSSSSLIPHYPNQVLCRTKERHSPGDQSAGKGDSGLPEVPPSPEIQMCSGDPQRCWLSGQLLPYLKWPFTGQY